ncbi:MAG: 1-acyl-sn-glycerol-3-phosphate acyltransferase [Verrucomicrobiales bacterium]|nr:1-acyl-sn-glycerol-3-phosphate acyltransferase [Verrucomicrobiales bacterium]
MIDTVVQSVCVGLVKLITGAHARGMELGREDFKPRVYYANHGSHLDFVALWAALPTALRSRTRPVAALDYWTAGGIRHWMSTKIFRAVLIDRKKVTRENNPVEQMKEVLDKGESIIVFPEGTRSSSGEIGAFKSGLFHLAKNREGTEFIPVFLQNLNRVLPRGEFLPIPFLTTIAFGPPLTLEPDETREAFLERARSAIQALQPAH